MLRETLARLRTEGFIDSNICLVLRTNEEVDEYADWLKAAGETVRRLDRTTPDDQEKPGLRVATMHRVKGLEFDAVIIAGYKSPEYYAQKFADDGDSGRDGRSAHQRAVPAARGGDPGKAVSGGEWGWGVANAAKDSPSCSFAEER